MTSGSRSTATCTPTPGSTTSSCTAVKTGKKASSISRSKSSLSCCTKMPRCALHRSYFAVLDRHKQKLHKQSSYSSHLLFVLRTGSTSRTAGLTWAGPRRRPVASYSRIWYSYCTVHTDHYCGVQGIMNSYTLEASYGGSNCGNKAYSHFTPRDYEQVTPFLHPSFSSVAQVGRYFCETLLDFNDPSPPKEQLRYKILLKLLREKSTATEPNNIILSEYSRCCCCPGLQE